MNCQAPSILIEVKSDRLLTFDQGRSDRKLARAYCPGEAILNPQILHHYQQAFKNRVY